MDGVNIAQPHGNLPQFPWNPFPLVAAACTPVVELLLD